MNQRREKFDHHILKIMQKKLWIPKDAFNYFFKLYHNWINTKITVQTVHAEEPLAYLHEYKSYMQLRREVNKI